MQQKTALFRIGEQTLRLLTSANAVNENAARCRAFRAVSSGRSRPAVALASLLITLVARAACNVALAGCTASTRNTRKAVEAVGTSLALFASVS